MRRRRRKLLGPFARVFMIIALVLSVGGGFAASYLGRPSGAPTAPSQRGPGPSGGGEVGELRASGLRIIPSGHSDASSVLDPARFQGHIQHAYWIATQIPEVLNQLYCWCGCIDRGVHRSTLQCFEDMMGVTCDVCQRTAEIAYRMVEDGVRDAGTIQREVDAKLAPPERQGRVELSPPLSDGMTAGYEAG